MNFDYNLFKNTPTNFDHNPDDLFERMQTVHAKEVVMNRHYQFLCKLLVF